ncbi:hypothetical protein EDF78_101436 [Rahnella sp. BIGb0236]|uniref:AVAST type 4 anti-phage nuclease Avs4 n=1 Tax=Rahnella sp. BIGb0236 TaxID=2485117 RepID=UPI0010605F93|nr:AVAST type 4 anti-phage nuclease Avs4 [Rahnella sp. BIGb0236]TDS98061.1 hypothetical protein EDF78_101436 [Rahnella sp. BIGb0236]
MVKPDWDIFKAKFSDNPQYHFEWLCYLLFCKTYERSYGVFRYKNQSAIETNPITHENKRIGFQAKFYDSSLTRHKQDILDTLKKAKRDYPDIDVIIFYSNQEWGQVHLKGKSATKSKALMDIEKEALRLNIELQWCTASFFESHFVCVDCKKISKYFFQIESNLINFISYLDNHTSLILSSIQEKIIYKENEIIFNRGSILSQLENTSSYKVSILSGVGGIGKTVEIKNLYNKVKNTIPIFVFKASEFEINRLDELSYDGGSIYDFAEYFEENENKIIVIDSAEKLLDLSNQDPIKEFISLISNNDWKIIFTTRLTYLDDLNFLCIEVLDSEPLTIYIPSIEIDELKYLATSNCFPLPKDDKLIDLLQIPLYLNEYLKLFNSHESFDYANFKNKLWSTKIKCRNIKREQVFLKLAFERASKGVFFLKADNDSIDVINELVADGILGSEKNTYFIAHDLYEEWALEIKINQEYNVKVSTSSFFMNIGSSLPIRRAFRNWMSDQLSSDTNSIEKFIEDLIDDEMLDSFWKDEVIVSVLLSKYSKNFFDLFDEELITTKLELFKRICFMLRIACKEFDSRAFENLGLKPIAKTILPYGSLFTMPKGDGWNSLIEFLYRKVNQLNKTHANYILPILYDWNNKHKEGYTTRLSALIALKFYQSEGYRRISKPDDAHHLLSTISYGAKEIKDELSTILNEIVTKKYVNHDSPYIGLSYLILTEMTGLHIVNNLPEKTLLLAKLFWLKDYSNKDDSVFHGRDSEEEPYGVTDDYKLKYYPESPYQTPIIFLLASSQKETIDFIIEFINSVANSFVKYYGESNFLQLDVHNSHFKRKIFSNEIFWCMYRGSAGNVPNLVTSILMALEKYCTDRGETTSGKTLEYWLLYLLEKSNSVIIYGLVNSVVLAFPNKTYNIAKILFSIKDFILYDNRRFLLDQSLKGQINSTNQLIGKPESTDLHEITRLQACDDKHRKLSLESLFFNYQITNVCDLTEEKYLLQREGLWKTLDNYYAELPNLQDSEEKKLWRLCLARIDIRKMDLSTQSIDGQTVVTFSPNLDDDIMQYSQTSLKRVSEELKFIHLNHWAKGKLQKNEISKECKKYDDNPGLAFAEAKEILRLSSHRMDDFETNLDTFNILNIHTPIYVFTTLVKYYKDTLSSEDIEYCISKILETLSLTLQSSYQFQHGSGVDYCFYVLPDIISFNPTYSDQIKIIVLYSLFNTHPIGFMGGDYFYSFATNYVMQLWTENIQDAQSILFSYIRLVRKRANLVIEIRATALHNRIYQPDFTQVLTRFLNENEDEINSFINNEIPYPLPEHIKDLDLVAMNVALSMIPSGAMISYKNLFIDIISSAFSYLDKKDSGTEYIIKVKILRCYAHFILSANENDLDELLQPFIDALTPSQFTVDCLNEIVLTQDRLAKHDNFWYIWKKLLPSLEILINDFHYNYRIGEIIKAYLFVQRWKDSAKSWHTFEPRDKRFFKIVSDKFGQHPATLLALAKLFSDIGSEYLDDGLYWLATIIDSNPSLQELNIENNTLFYLDKNIKFYLYENKEKVKKSAELKKCTLTILKFLIDKGEVSAYMLRESII